MKFYKLKWLILGYNIMILNAFLQSTTPNPVHDAYSTALEIRLCDMDSSDYEFLEQTVYRAEEMLCVLNNKEQR